MKIKNKIKSLINILESSKINSLEVSSFWGFNKIKLTKKEEQFSDRRTDLSNSDSGILDQSDLDLKKQEELNLKSSDISKNINISEEKKEGYIQKAPLVGTVYLSPKPDEANFIKEGDKIKKGQIICIIEAMKIFNEIEADKDGLVTKILVDNESPVEFGQPIIDITLDDV
ncbi:MAG: acetyl-CoA carboxylase, biotin carboxyl carrier protein [Candidatus Marinimicrobia bacterium]|nr:acetyl-CoA carboxylase, biotin carboxyl carrier protein [Candidatus Neomarinimicrobiota bacterium]|tara:strand:+ start:874 stop:1386 length:513 start_codon:yes stop_codon:yes gene_type:complete